MPDDKTLADRMRHALADQVGISEKAMFGGVCWMLNGNMLSGVGVGRYMFRVGKDLQAEALKRPGAEVVAFNGGKMGGIPWVDAQAADQAGLDTWLELAKNFVGSLPGK